jgi:hypothetical protein
MKNQRGDATMIIIAILAVVLIGGALFYNLRGKTNSDVSTTPQQKSSTQEIKKDSDGAKLEDEMTEGAKVKTEDAEPTESDMGL